MLRAPVARGGRPGNNYTILTIKVTVETVRVETAAPAATTARAGQDPRDQFTDVIIKSTEMEAMASVSRHEDFLGVREHHVDDVSGSVF